MIDRRFVQVRGMKLKWPRLVGLCGDSLYFVEGRDFLGVVDHTKDTLGMATRVSWLARKLIPVKSEPRALVRSTRDNYWAFWDLDRQKVVTEIYGPGALAIGSGFIEDDEAILFSRAPGLLEARSLITVQPIFSAPATNDKPYVFSGFVPVLGTEKWAVIGHWFLDSMDELVFVSPMEVVRKPAALKDALELRPLLRAPTVVAGPGAEGEIVALAIQDDPSTAASREIVVWSVSDGRALERVVLPVVASRRVELMASPSWVVASLDESVWILPRAGNSSAPVTMAARAVGFDAPHAQFAAITPQGWLEVVRLEA